MRLINLIMLVVVLALIGGLGLISLQIYNESYAQPEPFSATLPGKQQLPEIMAPSKVTQFYPNMRFPDRIITFGIESYCSAEKFEAARRAFEILEDATILEFRNTMNNPQISVICSEKLEEPADGKQKYFIAGEGGPTEIINTSLYSAILSGKIALYRDEKCGEPKVAIHEILHALGFDHINNSKSIMNPISDCSQELDLEIIDMINKLYSVKAAADLAIESAEGSKTGKYIDFNISIINDGLKDAIGADLEIYADDTKAGNFTLGNLEIGTRKILGVQNLAVQSDTQKITFLVKTKSNQEELNNDNNRAEIMLAR